MRVVVFYHHSVGKRGSFHPISRGNARYGQSDLGVSGFEGVFVARDDATGEKQWAGTRVDLMSGSNSRSGSSLRADTRVSRCY